MSFFAIILDDEYNDTVFWLLRHKTQGDEDLELEEIKNISQLNRLNLVRRKKNRFNEPVSVSDSRDYTFIDDTNSNRKFSGEIYKLTHKEV